ncbi:MAG: hypothetical protein AB2L14_36185 [Candidatus Xenobiia bacterium LiM19]
MSEVITFTAADMPDNTVIFSEYIQPAVCIMEEPARQEGHIPVAGSFSFPAGSYSLKAPKKAG